MRLSEPFPWFPRRTIVLSSEDIDITQYIIIISITARFGPNLTPFVVLGWLSN
jgi:hypothetical protein